MIFTILGGGSAYAPGLVAAIIHNRARLALSEVRLFDIDAERLDVVSRLCAGLARAAGAGFSVRAAPSLEEAVRGAKAILNSTRPGGLAARQRDEEIPLAFGIPGQETVGPGGFFFALRSVPVALEVADVVARLAPDAWILNYTNPTNVVTQALVERGDVRVLGLCDQSDGDLHVLAESMGLSGPIELLSTGTNHGSWYSGIRFGGRAIDDFDAARADRVQHHDEEHRIRFVRSAELARECGRPGAWPNSYLPYYTHPQDFVALSRRIGSRSAIIQASLPGYYRHFAEEAAKPAPVLRRHRGGSNFGDMAVEVLAAITRPAGQRLVLNVPSRGSAPGYDDDTIVETVVEWTANGPVRVPGPKVPDAFATLHRALERYQRAAARAAAPGSSAAARAEALAENPLVPSVEIARALLSASSPAPDRPAGASPAHP